VLGEVDALRWGAVVDRQREPYFWLKVDDERAKLKHVFRCARETECVSTTSRNGHS
jgi:hypothetical protein